MKQKVQFRMENWKKMENLGKGIRKMKDHY